MDTHTSENTITAIVHGRVHRHTSRGLDTEGSKEVKEKEDKLCAAGLRDAHLFKSEYKMMQREMSKLSPLISKFTDNIAEMQDLHTACGKAPVKPAPSEETIKHLRAQVGAELGLTAVEAEVHAPSSKWRYRLIQVLIKEGGGQ